MNEPGELRQSLRRLWSRGLGKLGKTRGTDLPPWHPMQAMTAKDDTSHRAWASSRSPASLKNGDEDGNPHGAKSPPDGPGLTGVGWLETRHLDQECRPFELDLVRFNEHLLFSTAVLPLLNKQDKVMPSSGTRRPSIGAACMLCGSQSRPSAGEATPHDMSWHLHRQPKLDITGSPSLMLRHVSVMARVGIGGNYCFWVDG